MVGPASFSESRFVLGTHQPTKQRFGDLFRTQETQQLEHIVCHPALVFDRRQAQRQTRGDGKRVIRQQLAVAQQGGSARLGGLVPVQVLHTGNIAPQHVGRRHAQCQRQVPQFRGNFPRGIPVGLALDVAGPRGAAQEFHRFVGMEAPQQKISAGPVPVPFHFEQAGGDQNVAPASRSPRHKDIEQGSVLQVVKDQEPRDLRSKEPRFDLADDFVRVPCLGAANCSTSGSRRPRGPRRRRGRRRRGRRGGSGLERVCHPHDFGSIFLGQIHQKLPVVRHQ
mmetsp:Transcript_27587/g.64685  ORF Transcript_27587/g.64685 Transcript_27587/m.64685 type:complete len:280 (-) Transcript_27587:1001-1840(-)